MTFAEAYAERASVWSDIGDHLAFLYATVLSYEKPDVVELGVRSGNSTSAFLAALEANGGHLWSVDINPPQVPAEWHDSELWTFHHGNDLDMQAVLPETCDVLFIDTSHTMEHTLAELRAFVPRVRPGGIVLCHDTQWLYPNISLPRKGGPVTEALDVFCAETGHHWENRDSAPGYYGLGVIRP